MAVRFRIKTSAGQELSFATHEMFEDFVRLGELSPDDLVYDGETGSWSPARTNPAVLDIEYEKEAEAAEIKESAADEGASGEDLGLSLAAEQPRPDDDESESVAEAAGQEEEADKDLGLNLAPVTEKSAEEAARDFVKKMEAERESQFDYGRDQGLQGFAMEDSSSMADMLAPAPPPAPEPAMPPAPAPAMPDRPVPPAPDRAAPVQSKTARPEPKKDKPKKDKPKKDKPKKGQPKNGGGARKVMVGGVVIAVLGAGGYAGYRTLVVPPEAPPPDPVVPIVVETPPEPEPEPEIASTVAAVRERAQERFLTATQNALRGLSPIPEAWPFGGYLSVPSEHADVLETWEMYLTTIRQVRSQDNTRYRDAYESALDDALIAEDARPERRDAAMLAFEQSAEQRAAHFDRVEALATAAIQSHSALVETEGLILFEQGGSAGGRDGLGAGAYGRDAEAELLLSQVLGLLDAALDADGLGPGDGASVREWVWDGFLDAVTASVAATNAATPTGVTN